MLRRSTKILLTIEAVICFGPIFLLLLAGFLLIPIQVYAIVDEPLVWWGPVIVIGSVVCGCIGLVTLMFVLGKLFLGNELIGRPTLICIGVALGALPVVPIVVQGDTLAWKFVGALPLAVSAHILILARDALFSSWRAALRSIATATTAALVLVGLLMLDPFSASSKTLHDQKMLWDESAPQRYEFTVQLSGWLKTEDLIPKRIVVENQKVISANYVWDGFGHKAGDVASLDDLWNIDRAFAEVAAAQDRGFRVSARFNERWGFIEGVFVDGAEPDTGWDLEIREFSATSDPVEDSE